VLEIKNADKSKNKNFFIISPPKFILLYYIIVNRKIVDFRIQLHNFKN